MKSTILVTIEHNEPYSAHSLETTIGSVLSARYAGCMVGVSCEHPRENVKFAVVDAGEFDFDCGLDVELATVIRQAGRFLDKACVGDICGDNLFFGEDGRLYTVNVEAMFEEMHPDVAAERIQDFLETDEAGDEKHTELVSRLGDWLDCHRKTGGTPHTGLVRERLRRLDVGQLLSVVEEVYSMMYENNDGVLDPDKDVSGADLVQVVAQRFDRLGVVPEAAQGAT